MHKPKVVSELMTSRVITLFEEDNLVGVEKGMRDFQFRHLPVVDGGRLVGLVTHRDLLRVAASIVESGGSQKTAHINENVFVRDVMQKNVRTVKRTTPVAEAGTILWETKLGCLPVVDDEGLLVGIVTEADFVRLAVSLLVS